MPRYITPPDMPPEVVTIIDVIGSRARQGIMRELAQQGPRTTVQLCEAITGSRSTTHRHLEALEAAGLVVADIPPGQRVGRGRVPKWTLQPEAITAYVDQLRRYLLGE